MLYAIIGDILIKTLMSDDMVPLNKILQVRIIGSKYKMLGKIKIWSIIRSKQGKECCDYCRYPICGRVHSV